MNAMNQSIIRRGEAKDIPALMSVWERSASATHGFLTRDDIVALRPQVMDALGGLEVWVAEEAGEPCGFMALWRDRIEALFIDTPHMGRGMGSRLIRHAREMRGSDKALRVDVNEDNPKALRFYRARGFEVTGRSPIDGAGKPWPLLHLVLPPDE